MPPEPRETLLTELQNLRDMIQGWRRGSKSPGFGEAFHIVKMKLDVNASEPCRSCLRCLRILQ